MASNKDFKRMTGVVSLNYHPTLKQRMFHASSADEVLFGGAAGGGKSKAIGMDALMRCLRWPGTHAYVFRRTYSELEDTVIKEARSSCPEALGKYNAARHERFGHSLSPLRPSAGYVQLQGRGNPVAVF